jgi:hypothetical protein
MKTIIQRLRAETPKFFKVLRNAAISCGAVATALIASNDTLGLNLGIDLVQLLKYAIAVSVAVASVSQTTKTT